VHRAIPGIAVIFHVIRKLTLERGIHVRGSLQPSRAGSTPKGLCHEIQCGFTAARWYLNLGYA
jgi:hypothetical protein